MKAPRTLQPTETQLATPNSIAIRCHDISRSFGTPPITVLSDIHLEVPAGQFVALTGRSGSGKSTLLYVLSGLDEATTGEVFLNGRPMRNMQGKEQHLFRNQHIGFVFQFHYLLPELTALENILMPARKQRLHEAKLDFARSLIAEFSLEHCTNKRPSQMSGGEAQRCAIARSLIMQPDILFTDEPTGNLDTANGDRVIELFRRINREQGTTIIMVTHDPDYAKATAREIHLVDGRMHSDRLQGRSESPKRPAAGR